MLTLEVPVKVAQKQAEDDKQRSSAHNLVDKNYKTEQGLPTALERTIQAISAVVQTVPVGTNLASVHILQGADDAEERQERF